MIQENVRKVFSDIKEICQNVDRDPNDITIVGVTKMVALDAVQEAIDAGIRHIAENRVQEAEHKFPLLLAKNPQIKTHIIGHLQTNKAKDAIAVCSLIQSVDSLKLAQEIEKQAIKRNKILCHSERKILCHSERSEESQQDKIFCHSERSEESQRHSERSEESQQDKIFCHSERSEESQQDKPIEILVQFNTAYEEQKFGAEPKDAATLIEGISRLSFVHIKGLMCMAPYTEDQGVIRKTFSDLRDIRDNINTRFSGHPRVDMGILSMGMSSDYKIAIEEGSTMVRIGSAIFK